MNGDQYFGVTSIDSLIFTEAAVRSGGTLAAPTPSRLFSTICIVGPDGVGKSLLALHAASWYWATAGKDVAPLVIYASTDLTYSQASKAWCDFGLGSPAGRAEQLGIARPPELKTDKLKLEWLSPFNGKDSPAGAPQPKPLREIFDPDKWKNAVWFLDLATESAGDDWSFLNRLLGATLCDSKKSSHLLVVDAVEGLEALVGNRDAFGQKRSRRSRVAQLIRNAQRANVTVVLVIEESRNGIRLPEEFIADLVLRVRVKADGDYSRRTVEVDKARGVRHTRGQHDLIIRSGGGTGSGRTPNIDDPALQLDGRPLAHLYVLHSLHAKSRRLQRASSPLPPLHPTPGGAPLFGLPALDASVPIARPSSTGGAAAESSISQGSLSVLIGESGNYKSRLARAFLAQAFASRSKNDGAAILISSYPIERTELRDQLGRHLAGTREGGEDYPTESTFIMPRHIGQYYVSSSGFLEIVQTYIRRAQEELLKAEGEEFANDLTKRRKDSWRIRVAIDDWSVLLATHPNLAADPLLLQSLVFLFQNEGVTALLVATQAGSPKEPTQSSLLHDVRSIDTCHVHTWPVTFYGERHVAVTIMSSAGARTIPPVYELRPRRYREPQEIYWDSEQLDADPHFLYYTGLEEHQPRRVPLTVRLYTGYHTQPGANLSPSLYVEQLKQAFNEIFSSPLQSDVLSCKDIDSYDHLANFVDLLDDSRLDHTLIVQLDEFWAQSPRALMNTEDFWKAETCFTEVTRTGWKCTPIENADPTGSCQAHPPNSLGEGQNKRYRRREFFLPELSELVEMDRVPYLWDFGILLGRRDLWVLAAERPVAPDRIGEGPPSPSLDVRQVWNSLCCDADRIGEPSTKRKPAPRRAISWGEFFRACSAVAEGTGVAAFDIDLRTRETLCALVLEIWASEALKVHGRDAFDFATERSGRGPSLRKLAEDLDIALYIAMGRLFLACIPLKNDGMLVEARSASPEAVCSRHWYSTAAVSARTHRHLVPLRLPGSFSVRGDWFLGIAAGSRSSLLGQRALDLLTSRRMNLLRLHDGLGLPVRDIVPFERIGELRTALMRSTHDSDEKTTVPYKDILSFLAADEQEPKQLRWLWRSRISGYAQHSLYFYRWICRVYLDRRSCFNNDPKKLDLLEAIYPNLAQKPTAGAPEWDEQERLEVFRAHTELLLSVMRESAVTFPVASSDAAETANETGPGPVAAAAVDTQSEAR